MTTSISGWSSATIEQAINVNGVISDGDWVESKDQDPNGDVRLIQLADVGDGVFRDKSNRFMTSEKAETMRCTFLQAGDVLIARMPDPLGRACVFPGVEQKSVTVVDVCLIRMLVGSAFDNKCLMYWLNSPEVRARIASQASGTTRKRITRKKLEALELPVPPLAEQKQIAAKLDELLAQVDTIEARLDAIPAILKRFRQSVLAAAVSGRLTEDRRKHGSEAVDLPSLLEKVESERKALGFRAPRNPSPRVSHEPFEIPDSWIWARLGSLALKITDGAHNTPRVLDSGFPYLMAKDLTEGILDFSVRRYISEHEHRELYKKCQPFSGDLLVVNIGAGTGNNVLVNVDFEFSFKNIAIVKRPSFIVPKYLKWHFDARKDAIFREQTRGGAQPFLSLTVLNDLEFALPPENEQTEIVRRVDQLFAFADQIEQRIQAAQARVDHLTQSILAKAFRGELTAEWRAQHPELITGENSAEALLARIRAERANAPKARRGRRKATV